MSRSLWLFVLLSARLTASADPLADGDAALQKYNLDSALASYRQACSNAPTNYEAAWKLARALVDKGTLTKARAEQKKLFAEAEQTARKAVRLNPKDSRGHAWLAIAVGKLAIFEGGKRKVELSNEIKVEAEKAIALNPKEDLAYHVLGIWHRELAQLNWALKQFAQLLYGKFPPASMEAAEKNLRKATELSPTAIAHRVEYALILNAAGKRKEAQEQFAKSLELPKTWVTDDYYREIAKRNYRSTTKT
jgi:Flp pilus assembly protein TadD